jgi:hypothetical protein
MAADKRPKLIHREPSVAAAVDPRRAYPPRGLPATQRRRMHPQQRGGPGTPRKAQEIRELLQTLAEVTAMADSPDWFPAAAH